MIDSDMRAGIELTGLQIMRGHEPGTPLTQAIVDATRALLAAGGTGVKELIEDRDATRYVFTGPSELVQPVIAAFMAFIKSTEDS